jgi:hypothetical protein
VMSHIFLYEGNCREFQMLNLMNKMNVLSLIFSKSFY